MESLLLENKWLFLIGAEVSFWVLSGAFLVLRYWFGSDRGSLALLALIVLDNLFILALGVLDYLSTGEFAMYQIVIAAVLVYGLTSGKGDMKRLDAYLKKRVASWKGQVPAEAPPSPRGQSRQAPGVPGLMAPTRIRFCAAPDAPEVPQSMPMRSSYRPSRRTAVPTTIA
jgi:hypothetical protein